LDFVKQIAEKGDLRPCRSWILHKPRISLSSFNNFWFLFAIFWSYL